MPASIGSERPSPRSGRQTGASDRESRSREPRLTRKIAISSRDVRVDGEDLRSLAVGLAYLSPALFIFVALRVHPLGPHFLHHPLQQPIDRWSSRRSTPRPLHRPDHVGTFRSSLVATGLFALYTVPIGIALGLILAVLLNQRLRGISVFRTMMASTIAISAAVGSLIWLLLFNPSLGLLNYVLSLVGVRGPEWLIQPTIAIIAVSITTIWLTLGTNIIVLLAGLQGISEEIYEAARLDGARGLRMFTRITVPMVSPSLFFLPRGRHRRRAASVHADPPAHARRPRRRHAHARLQHLPRRLQNFQFRIRERRVGRALRSDHDAHDHPVPVRRAKGALPVIATAVTTSRGRFRCGRGGDARCRSEARRYILLALGRSSFAFPRFSRSRLVHERVRHRDVPTSSEPRTPVLR